MERCRAGECRNVASRPVFWRNYRIQWWYFTGHLFDAAGREFGYELTFFPAGEFVAIMGNSGSVTRVINKISFGWEVGFGLPFFTLSVLMAFLLITTMLAGLVPSYLARKIDPKAFISFE